MTEKIDVEKIVDQTGLTEQEVRTVLVKLASMGWINSHHIPTYHE